MSRDELPEGLRANFDRVDTNGDGFISPDEDRRVGQGPPRPQAKGKGQGPVPSIPDSVRSSTDLAYAATDNPRQRLDLYVPKAARGEKPLPLVVFIHGGAFRAGDKRSGWPMIARLVTSGAYAGASVGYRLSGEITWPANSRLQGRHSLASGQREEVQRRSRSDRRDRHFGRRPPGCDARHQQSRRGAGRDDRRPCRCQ